MNQTVNLNIKRATIILGAAAPGISMTGIPLDEALKSLHNIDTAVSDALIQGDGVDTLATAGTIPELGQLWPEQGGIRAAYMPPEGDQPGYSIIVPMDPAAEKDGLTWGPTNNEVKGLSERDGLANTNILAAGKHPAAKFCADLRIGDHADFYLMANREASLLRAVAPHLFSKGLHWTSTPSSAHRAFVQDFSDGNLYHGGKGYDWRVRAVRRFIH